MLNDLLCVLRSNELGVVKGKIVKGELAAHHFNNVLSDENESGFFRRDSRKSAKKDSWMMTDKGRKHFGAPQKCIKKSPAKSNKKTTGKTTK